MFLVSRRSCAGTPANNEHASLKASGLTSVPKLHSAKAARTCCNTRDGSVGAARSPAVAAGRAGNVTTTQAKAYFEQKPSATSPADTSLSSHEIHLMSDVSDADEVTAHPSQGDASLAAVGATAPDVPPHYTSPLGATARGDSPSLKHGGSGNQRPQGPASALSTTVVSAVRRRVKRGLPRAVAVAARSAAATAAAAAPPPPPQMAAEPGPAVPTAPTATGDNSRSNGDLGRTGLAVAVLLMVLVAAAASGSLRLMSAAPALRAPAPRHGVGDGGRSAGGRTAPSYFSGWAARLWGGTTAAPRGSIIATAVSADSARRAGRSTSSSSTSSSRITSSSSSTTSSVAGAVVSGGGVDPRRWWFGRTSSGPRGGGTLPPPPQPHPSLAAASGSAPEPGSPSLSFSEYEWRESASVRVITIVQGGAASPYGTTWEALADHTAKRLEWTDTSYQMLVFRAEALGSEPGLQAAFLRAAQGGAQLLVGLDVTDAAAESFLLRDPQVAGKLPGVALFVGGSEVLSKGLTQLQGGLRPLDPGSWRTALARRLAWTPDGQGLAVWDTVQLLLGRHDSDNFLFVYLVLINQYVTTVRQVADTTKGFDLQSIICMAKNCGSKVVGCVQDATCKAALDCLQSCTFNDQVCQYRCIVSYESPLLEQFSLCILQLHNCRNLDAKPPLLPDPAPMSSFRGVPLTHGSAEELFFGWLDQPGQGAPASNLLGDREGKPYSWLVAAGKNPAYDYFPCQHQLYYRGKASGVVWYEPVFKAITLDGRTVWRRRVYRVRRGKVPGTFHLSVLDNGVTSNEYWRILDCDDNLEYCLFYYSGAAASAGLSYSGAVLGTPDGRMPGPQHTSRLHAALRRAGIEPWELSYVNNQDCGGAPLQITGPVARPPAPAPAA